MLTTQSSTIFSLPEASASHTYSWLLDVGWTWNPNKTWVKRNPFLHPLVKYNLGFCVYLGGGVVCLISWHNEGTNTSHVARHVCSVTKSSQFYLLNSPPIHLLGSGCSYRLAGFNTPMQPPYLHLGPSATHFLSNTSLKQCSWACGKSFSNRKLRS